MGQPLVVGPLQDFPGWNSQTESLAQDGMIACQSRGRLVGAGKKNPPQKRIPDAELHQVFDLLLLICRRPGKSSARISGEAGNQVIVGQGPYRNFVPAETAHCTQRSVIATNDKCT